MEQPSHKRPMDESISAEVVEAFTAATVAAFQELCAVEVVPGEPGITDGDVVGDVLATLTLKREPDGRLVLAFPLAVLEALAKCYLGEAISLSAEILDDAAGEFANVIAGQAKTMLKGHPAHYLITPPMVHRGTLPGAGNDWLHLPFECERGAFSVLVRLP